MDSAKILKNQLENYEYMNEDSIDAELKCSLCMQPFQSPSSGPCGHTFCENCINQWLNRQATCPTCRANIPMEQFRQVSTRIVLNQLERLQLRCKRCKQANIQRCDIIEHEKRCPNQTVSCPAFDIQCKWKGTRNELTQHSRDCLFQKIHPAIDGVYQHLKDIYEPLVDELQVIRQQLEKQLQRTNKQNRFLVAVFNKGKPMSNQCTGQSGPHNLNQQLNGQSGPCYLQQNRSLYQAYIRSQEKKLIKNRSRLEGDRYITKELLEREMLSVNAEFQNKRDSSPRNQIYCANCRRNVNGDEIALHHCTGGCICNTCFNEYGNLQ